MQRLPGDSHTHRGHFQSPLRLRPQATPVDPSLRRNAEAPLPQRLICIRYEDDTLIVAEGTIVNEVHERANAVLNIVSEHIRNLSLCLAIDKTQTMVFTRRHS